MKSRADRRTTDWPAIRILIATIMIELFAGTGVFAQRFMTTFGEVADIRTIRHPQGILTGDFNGDGIADLAVWSSSQIWFYYQDKDNLAFRTGNFFVNRPILAAAAARCNNDRLTDLVLVTGDPLTVSVYLARAPGKFFLAWSRELRPPFEKMLLADLNSDRKTDLLFYGKKELGITMYPGNGNGSFGQPVILMPEYSFSDLAVATLNDNGNSDILAVNWISNQILVFSGFGKLKFSEPSVIQCQSEPAGLNVVPVDFDVNKDLIAAFPEEQSIGVFLGDGLGGFHASQKISVSGGFLGIAAADLNGDGGTDCAVLAYQGLSVLMNNGEGMLGDEIRFSAGRAPDHFILFQHGGTDAVDAAVLDTTYTQVRILYTSRASGSINGEWNYGVGTKPDGIATGDMNHDGWDDVAVANTGTRTLSLFLNQGGGKLGGQLSYDVSIEANDVRFLSPNDSTALFLLTGRSARMISVAGINTKSFSHSLYTIPTQGIPEILAAGVDTLSGLLSLIVLERDGSKASVISLEQIRKSQFVERPIQLTPPYPLLNAVVGDFTGDGRQDIAYVVYDRRRQSADLYQANAITAAHQNHGMLLGAVNSSETIAPMLWTGDVNRDGRTDLLLYAGAQQNQLQVYFGSAESQLTPARNRDKITLELSSAGRLKVFDLNGDGYPDLLFENSRRKTLQVFFGHGDGSFSSGLRLGSTEAVGDFCPVFLRKNDLPELVMTDVLAGILNVIGLQEE